MTTTRPMPFEIHYHAQTVDSLSEVDASYALLVFQAATGGDVHGSYCVREPQAHAVHEPQRSPRVRDHWRDEGPQREDSDYRGREPERSTDRWRSPVAAKNRERSIDAEVKIKGRASIEAPRRHSPHRVASIPPTERDDRVLRHAAEDRGRSHTSIAGSWTRTDTAIIAVVEKVTGNAPRIGEGRGLHLRIEQLPPTTGTFREVQASIIHVILVEKSTRGLVIAEGTLFRSYSAASSIIAGRLSRSRSTKAVVGAITCNITATSKKAEIVQVTTGQRQIQEDK
ncbi:MAG: hypothetical protein Q9206_001476 [Seirophora lacunosa]